MNQSLAAVPFQNSRPIVLMPKNRGLSKQVANTCNGLQLPQSADVCHVRGEDVPYLACQMASLGRAVYAITGDDLLDEWLAAGNTIDEWLKRRRIPWDDPNAMYGKPALCLIGRPGSTLAGAKTTRVAFCSRYQRLTEKYLTRAEARATNVQRIPIRGAVESVLLAGVADFIIDIVVTGRTIRERKLAVLDVIYTSDLAVLESQ